MKLINKSKTIDAYKAKYYGKTSTDKPNGKGDKKAGTK